MAELEQQVIQEWKSLDKKNEQALRDFFDYYVFLTCSDIAKLMKCRRSTINNYRLSAGISVSVNKNKTKAIKIPVELEPGIKPYEDTKEWWEEHYARFGYRKLATLSGLSNRWSVRDRLKALKIPLRPPLCHKPHPCDNYEWVYRNYVKGNIGARKMATIAGVALSTMQSWIDKHGIERRHHKITHVGKNPSQPDSKQI
jgi:hypothetical protein